MAKYVDLEVLVPAKNEAENLPRLVERIDTSLRQAHISYQVIVIDDRSTDTSLRVLAQLQKTYPLIIHSKQGQPGKAFALLEGAKLSTAPFLAMIDADLEYPPEALPELYHLALKSGMAVANRVSSHKSSLRRVVSKANRYVFGTVLLGLKCDVQSGLKVFNREIIEHLDTSLVRAWAIDIPLLHTAKLLGYDVSSANITFTPRTIGLSKCKSELTKAVREIGLGAVRVRFAKKRPITLAPTGPGSSLGSGVIHNRQRFITHTRLPHHRSALITLSPSQKFLLFSLFILLVTGIIIDPIPTGVLFIAVLSLIYFTDTIFSLFLVLRSFHAPPELSFTAEQLARLKDKDLPVYTVMCPLYKEKDVLPDFVAAMSNLNWPKSKLDVMLLLEENDPETVEAAKNMHLPSYIRIVVVPHSMPKTKPKACNYGLALAKGEFVVIYDAEDRPDRNQLKIAYLGFAQSGKNTVCLQAKLNYYNPNQNHLTRLFTAEYSLWFDVVLPGLQSINTTIPLGGTSNHFRTHILRELEGWDAFNVTEDCDLGCRLFKEGYNTGLIDSVTLEEANSHVGNWLRQRSRWIKGYMQTYFVHTRDWLTFARKRKHHAAIFHLIIGLRISFMLINPILWLATLSYFVAYKVVGPTIEALYPSWIFYLAGISLVFGNFLYLYYYMIGAAKRGHWGIIKYVFFVPVYWLLVSLAAMKAFYQLIVKPHFWEKTNHGLHLKTNRVSPRSFVKALPAWSIPVPSAIKNASWFSGAFLVVSSGLAFFCNFLYNAYLSHNSAVSFAEFGLIGLVGSFNYVIQIPVGALGRTVSYRSGYLFGKYDTPVREFWSYIRKNAFKVSLLFLGLWLLATPVLSRVFQTNGILPLLLYSPGWLIFALAAVDTGYLSGIHRFKTLGLLAIVEALAKLIITVALVELHRSAWIYAAVPLSAGVSFLLGWVAASRTVTAVPVEDKTYFPARFFSTSVLNRFSLLAFLSLDVIAAKAFLSPTAAGQYALVSVVGKIIYYAMSLFSQFITPVVSRAEGAGVHPGRTFNKLIAVSAGVGLVSFAGVVFFGKQLMPLLFGEKALSIITFLPLYTLAMVLFSIGSAIVDYHQARRQYEFAVFGFILAPLLMVAMYLFPRTVASSVMIVASLSGFYLAGVLIMHLLYDKFKIFLNNFLDFVELFTEQFRTKARKSAGQRILIFNWYDIKHVWAGGAEIYIHNVAKDWVAQGHHVTMFTGNDLHHSRHEVIDGVHVVRRGGLYTVALWGAIYYILKFRGKFDVVIDIPKGVPFFTPLFVRKPVICLIHQVHQEMFRNELRFPVKQFSCFLEAKLMPFVYRNVPIIAVSESTKKAVLEIGLGKKGIELAVPGVEITPAHVHKTSYPSVLYLGRLRPYKSVDILIAAVAQLVRQIPEIKLTIAGTGEEETNLQLMVKNLHLENTVHFAGRVSEREKAKLFTESWVAVQPSSVEGWGITNIEANLCGTPVIAANSDGLRDSVVDGVTGILFRTGDVNHLHAVLRHVLTDTDLRLSLGENALEWGKRFSWSETARQIMNVVNLQVAAENVATRGTEFERIH